MEVHAAEGQTLPAEDGGVCNLGHRRAFIAAVLGFACLYTIVIAFFYYDWIFELPFDVDALAYEVALNGSLCVGACCIAFVMKRRVAVKAVAWAGCFCYVAAFILMTLCFAMSPSLVYAVAACAGFAAGMLVPLWFYAASLVGAGRYGYVLGAASLVCGFTVIAVNALPGIGVACAFAVLLAVSMWLLFGLIDSATLRSGQGESAEPPRHEAIPIFGSAVKEAVGPLVLPLVYVLFLSVIYGALDEMAAMSGPLDESVSGVMFQLCGIVADSLFLIYAHVGRGRYASLFNVVLGVIATGLVLLPFLSASYGFVLLIFVHAGWDMALLVSYALVIEVLHNKRGMLIAGAAVVFAFPRPGVVAGSWAASIIAVDNQFTFAQTVMLAFALLYVVMAGVWFVRMREKRAADRAIHKRDELIRRYAQARDDLYEMVCADMTQEYGLTKREGELLYLFAQGRDLAYVESHLYLSRNTVKSYTKSLYAKLDVHSRQELIDLVKANFSSKV